MTDPSETRRGWLEALEDGVWARWRWLIAFVVLIFVLNNLFGLIVGALGAVAFANRLVGRALRAQRLAQQVRQVVADPPDE
jgi:hypothetical protein